MCVCTNSVRASHPFCYGDAQFKLFVAASFLRGLSKGDFRGEIKACGKGAERFYVFTCNRPARKVDFFTVFLFWSRAGYFWFIFNAYHGAFYFREGGILRGKLSTLWNTYLCTYPG